MQSRHRVSREVLFLCRFSVFTVEIFAKPQSRSARVPIMASATRTPLRNTPNLQQLERKQTTSDAEFVERLSKPNAGNVGR